MPQPGACPLSRPSCARHCFCHCQYFLFCCCCSLYVTIFALAKKPLGHSICTRCAQLVVQQKSFHCLWAGFFIQFFVHPLLRWAGIAARWVTAGQQVKIVFYLFLCFLLDLFCIENIRKGWMSALGWSLLRRRVQSTAQVQVQRRQANCLFPETHFFFVFFFFCLVFSTYCIRKVKLVKIHLYTHICALRFICMLPTASRLLFLRSCGHAAFRNWIENKLVMKLQMFSVRAPHALSVLLLLSVSEFECFDRKIFNVYLQMQRCENSE